MVGSGDGCECGRENGEVVGVESGDSARAQVEALAEERAAWIRGRLVKLRSKRRRMAKELGSLAVEERRLDVELRKLHSLREGGGTLSEFSLGDGKKAEVEGGSSGGEKGKDPKVRAAKKRAVRGSVEPPPSLARSDLSARPV